MGVDFTWELHDDEEQIAPPPARATQSPIVTIRQSDDTARPQGRRAWRWWALIACLMLVAVAGAWSRLSERANRHLGLAQADLLAVVQTEAKALASGDAALYRSLQAPSTGVSVRLAGEQAWLRQAAAPDGTGRQLLGLSWHGDQAEVWVGYTAGSATFARLQGYRHADGRWLRTELSQRRWGAARTLETAHFRFRYHEAEAAVVAFLARWAEALYANLDFGQQVPAPIEVELRPYLAQPLAWVGRGRVLLTSPLLLGVSPEALRGAPSPDTLAGLALESAAGLEVLADVTVLEPTLVAAFSHALALAMANEALDTSLYSDGVQWLMVEAAARYELKRLLPELRQDDADDALLRAALREGSVPSVTSLWPHAAVVAAEDDCRELPDVVAPGVMCYGRLGARYPEALAQAKSLIAYAEEQAATCPPGAGTLRFPLVSRFLAAVTASDEAAAVRFLFQEAAATCPAAAAFYQEPERFSVAWRAWLLARYG